jgi:hypothetical protein
VPRIVLDGNEVHAVLPRLIALAVFCVVVPMPAGASTWTPMASGLGAPKAIMALLPGAATVVPWATLLTPLQRGGRGSQC